MNTVEDYLEVWRIPSRIVAALSTGLAALALLLGSIGVYAMASYRVSRCVREIGIRMALGADGSEVMSLVLRQAMRPVLLGGLAGVAGCAAVSRVLSNMLLVSAHMTLSPSLPRFSCCWLWPWSRVTSRRGVQHASIRSSPCGTNNPSRMLTQVAPRARNLQASSRIRKWQ